MRTDQNFGSTIFFSKQRRNRLVEYVLYCSSKRKQTLYRRTTICSSRWHVKKESMMWHNRTTCAEKQFMCNWNRCKCDIRGHWLSKVRKASLGFKPIIALNSSSSMLSAQADSTMSYESSWVSPYCENKCWAWSRNVEHWNTGKKSLVAIRLQKTSSVRLDRTILSRKQKSRNNISIVLFSEPELLEHFAIATLFPHHIHPSE